MSWLQISITVEQKLSKQVETLLLDQGACSVTLKDAADEPIFEPAPGEMRLWQKTVVTGLFENTPEQNSIIANLQSSLEDDAAEIEVETLEDKDWSRTWMDHFQAMQFGERLWVCPHHVDPPDSEAVNLRLDPGLAFGTGTHPTTSLCLSWLDQHCDQQKNILDFGCGSGILAIAALMLGVQNADGIDIDAQALEASEINAKTNQVANRLQVYTPEQFKVIQDNKLETGKDTNEDAKKYAIVVANILSGPLIELAPTLAGYTQPNGEIILSGILLEQADAVTKAYARFFTMNSPVEKEDWVLLHGRKL
jgi:ribosomal protein L11 methyltransferase